MVLFFLRFFGGLFRLSEGLAEGGENERVVLGGSRGFRECPLDHRFAVFFPKGGNFVLGGEVAEHGQKVVVVHDFLLWAKRAM